MTNLRNLGRAATLSLLMGAAMVTFGPTLHAAPSQHSVTVRCGLLLRAIDTATALAGADSELVQFLWQQYATYCQE
jgi:hypothetical protein